MANTDAFTLDSSTWDVEGTAAWIRSVVKPDGRHAQTHTSSRVCLQLPDDLLAHAAELSASVQKALESDELDVDIYILADTTYNALSVDEVASAHVDADCIVHYGRASLSKTTGRVPVYYVFPRVDKYRYGPEGSTRLDLRGDDVDGERVEAGTTSTSTSTGRRERQGERQRERVTCFVDQVFKHAFQEVCAYIREELLEGYEVRFPALVGAEGQPSVGGYACVGDEWREPVENGDDGRREDDHFVWYGASDAPARDLLLLTYNARTWTSVDPIGGSIERGLPLRIQRTLRKRYFLVDKTRQANIIGLVVGTLAASGYKESINALRVAATKADKKTYTLLMGKPTPAKLANFPEIDVFVLVADPQGMILDSSDYYAPIVTPYEAMVAFSEDAQWEQHKYSLELVEGLDTPGGDVDREDGSRQLVVQAQEALRVARFELDRRARAPALTLSLALRASFVRQATISGSRKDIIPARSGAEYLVHKRTWKGVASGLGPGEKKEVGGVEIGRAGRAAGYDEGGE